MVNKCITNCRLSGGALIALLLILANNCKMHINEKASEQNPLEALEVVPSEAQIVYQNMELIGFIHFTINTFTDKEWGYGNESPELFNPTELNADQWAKTAKDAGMKQLILTAKHHDGFCLWPSKYSEHTIANSPYKKGNGDLVKEFVDACRKYGLKVGLYLSPWDRNHADYGNEKYITYYRNQLREILTQYGEINEIWFDGANGGDGYYGGANETRKIDERTYYDWPTTIKLVKELQPNIKIFSDAGPDIRWIGNEDGFAGETFWSPIHSDSLVIGKSNADYLNTGDANGNKWIVGQCDVSIRPGWFYHAKEDDKVKSVAQLIEIYEKSVGRNALLLLNLPPDRRGLIHENDVDTLIAFNEMIGKTFGNNLLDDSRIDVSNYRNKNAKYSGHNVLTNENSDLWVTDDDVSSATLTISLPSAKYLSRIILEEPIKYGQRIENFEINIVEGSCIKSIYKGTTIGHKRIVSFDSTLADKIEIKLKSLQGPVMLSKISAYN